MMEKPYISIVIPVYNEQEVLEMLYERLTTVMDAFGKPYEVILTNDGSQDNSRTVLDKIYQKRPDQFRIIHFNTNYGQHMAIMAGFERVRGDIVITLDADLQNPPEEIPNLIQKIEEGHDIVGTYRIKRKDKKWRMWVSKLHNHIRSLMIPKLKIKDEGCMLRAYRRHIVDLIASTGEHSTFIPALAFTYAANPVEISISHEPRAAGKTSYSLYKLIRYNFDLITNFSLVPLQVLPLIGAGIMTLSLLSIIYLSIRGFFSGLEINSLLFATTFFVMGIIILSLGILGEYIGRIYQETRNRPRFVIRDIQEKTCHPGKPA